VKKLKDYYDRFKSLNPQYSGIKLGIIVAVIVYFVARIFFVVEISRDMIISLAVFVISMTFHEVAHGYVAYKFGDNTAKMNGRITLNPLKHIDLTGIILPILILLSGFKFLVGLGKHLDIENIFMTILLYTYLINLLLGMFNLIPITPLDGGRIIYSFSGEKVRKFYNKIEKYGILIIFAIVYFGSRTLMDGFIAIVEFFLKLAGIQLNLMF